MADYQYIVASGIIVPITSDILAGVREEYKAAFGQDLDISPETPQGILITAESIARSNVTRNDAALANQINPNYAGGVFLDSLLALLGSERVPAEHTTVSCNLSGVAGTTILAGSRVSDTINNAVFESADTVILSGGGTGTVIFRAIDPGPLDIGIGTVTQILPPGTLDWETVTNPAVGTPGTFTESDATARNRRKVTLASQGSMISEAIISAVNNVEGVRIPILYRENFTGSNEVIDGITLVPHSIYVCVYGGVSLSIAEAIWSKKPPGTNFNGSTTVNVLDTPSGVTYPVKFQRPTEVPILVKATVKSDVSIQDPVATVKRAILDYAAGNVNGEIGFAVGADVSCFEIAGAITFEAPGIYVKKIETTDNIVVPAYSTDEIEIKINEIATLEDSSITVILE